MNIIKSSTPMKLKPNDSAPLETECLFGEKLEIIKENIEWIFGKLLTDNYLGWVKKKDLGFLNFPTHKIISIRTGLYNKKNIKSHFIHYLPFGSKLNVNSINKDWAEINLSQKHFYKVGYVLKKDIIQINEKVNDWVSIAEQFVGIPYKWGGRDTIGLDCSSLLQLAYETSGEIIPRNTTEQVKIKKKIIKDINKLNRGCVVFWEGHVGIMVDKFKCLHANAFHMKTVIEPLTKIINRMNSQNKIIKMIDFNT